MVLRKNSKLDELDSDKVHKKAMHSIVYFTFVSILISISHKIIRETVKSVTSRCKSVDLERVRPHSARDYARFKCVNFDLGHIFHLLDTPQERCGKRALFAIGVFGINIYISPTSVQFPFGQLPNGDSLAVVRRVHNLDG